MEGREVIDWLLDDIAKDGDGPPSGGKRRLIRGEGFASRISRNARPHDPGGATVKYPVPQNAMMNLRKSPMDTNTNRYEKLVQVPSRRADRSSSDGVTIEQCQSAYRQSTKTTVTEVYTNFADKPEPTQYQGMAVSAEEAGTDGTTNVQGRSIDCDNMKTTVMKLPTDCVKFTEPTLARRTQCIRIISEVQFYCVSPYKRVEYNHILR